MYGRGMARRKKGEVGGDADVTAAKSIRPDIDKIFADYGVK